MGDKISELPIDDVPINEKDKEIFTLLFGEITETSVSTNSNMKKNIACLVFLAILLSPQVRDLMVNKNIGKYYIWIIYLLFICICFFLTRV